MRYQFEAGRRVPSGGSFWGFHFDQALFLIPLRVCSALRILGCSLWSSSPSYFKIVTGAHLRSIWLGEKCSLGCLEGFGVIIFNLEFLSLPF